MTHLVFYMSGHGFGHASRDVEVINALLALDPSIRITIRTSVASWLLRRTVRGPFTHVPVECDTGLSQIDSLRLDVDDTVGRAAAFMADFPARVARDAAALCQVGASAVISDIPALGVAAGAAAGVPSLALGNFSWDWAYAGYAGTESVVAAIRDAYRRASVAFRLPMWGGFDAFPRVVDVPFIARRSARDPGETRRALGLPADTRLALVSFGGYGVDGLDLEALTRLDGYLVLVSDGMPAGPSREPLRAWGRRGAVQPLDEAAMYAAGLRYEDLVRAVDVVVTKPGYGIVAECIANDTALLYTSRGAFVEYEVLVREMPRYLRAGFIPQPDLLGGRWGPYLDALLALPAPAERPALDGAEVVARGILGMTDRK
ncbi:MAG: hypothetical protein AB1635_20595 [Acidobacteriota bacterium]